jgi:hypothetical protein
MKCSNCPADAIYNVLDPGVSPAYYCATCLPKSLRNRADAGQLDIPKPVAKKTAKKAAEEPVVETPVETPAPSEDSDEDPAV